MSAVRPSKRPESRPKRLGIAGIAILAAIQNALIRLKAPKIWYLRESVALPLKPLKRDGLLSVPQKCDEIAHAPRSKQARRRRAW
jgi:hypothetical protein